MRVRASNDLIHWVRFFLTGIAETSIKGRDIFRRILELRKEVEQSVLGLGKRTPTAQRMLNELYRKPVITALDVEKVLGVSKTTANIVINDFIQLGILVEQTGQVRGKVYAFQRYLKLFSS